MCAIPLYAGDDICDAVNNAEGCSYDGGDCCKENIDESSYCGNDCHCYDPSSPFYVAETLIPTSQGDLT